MSDRRYSTMSDRRYSTVYEGREDNIGDYRPRYKESKPYITEQRIIKFEPNVKYGSSANCANVWLWENNHCVITSMKFVDKDMYAITECKHENKESKPYITKQRIIKFEPDEKYGSPASANVWLGQNNHCVITSMKFVDKDMYAITECKYKNEDF